MDRRGGGDEKGLGHEHCWNEEKEEKGEEEEEERRRRRKRENKDYRVSDHSRVKHHSSDRLLRHSHLLDISLPRGVFQQHGHCVH